MISTRTTQSGNVLFMIMMAVILIAALGAAITKSDGGGSNLTREQAQIRAAAVASFATDIKRAAQNITRNGASEASISFASPNLTGYGTLDTAPRNEVFNIGGGGVAFVAVPDNASDGSQWEFYGTTAIPGVGDPAVADLVMVMPNVTEAFCKNYNQKAGFTDTAAIPTDTAACIHDTATRYAGTFSSSPNTLDTATFPAANTPYPAACVKCDSGAFHAYYVLLER